MTAGRKHSASLAKTKPNPHGVPYPMSLRSLARYLAEGLATLSRSPAGTQPLRRSNNEKDDPLCRFHAFVRRTEFCTCLGHCALSMPGRALRSWVYVPRPYSLLITWLPIHFSLSCEAFENGPVRRPERQHRHNR